MQVNLDRFFFKEYMKDHGLKLEDLAGMAGTSKSTMSRFIHGGNLGINTVLPLLANLKLNGYSIDTLFHLPN